jgi:hypothetical protein
MFRIENRSSLLTAILLVSALLACPCGMLAQRGAGGGHTGGGVAGGDGLAGVGRPSGVDVKDDLKDFHATLAVQATGDQVIQYGLMLKSTAAASAELQAFLEQLGKENNGSELASRDATIAQAIEKARTDNRKFLEGFSDPQRSGLKEIVKRLTKTDSDLALQAKALDLEAPALQVVSSAQNLERTLMTFRSEQIDLGEEMSIGAAGHGQDNAFNLPPVKSSITFANQPIAITTSGVISKGVAEGGQNTFKLELTSDLSDLQLNITDVLRAQLDRDARCGDRIEIQNATLTPLPPASLVTAQLHFERWACGTVLGRETTNEMVEGNGTLEVKLTPAIGEDGTLRLVPEMERVDVQGLVGDLLRSGSLHDALPDKIADSILSAVRQGEDFKTTLPAAAQGSATLRHVEFQGTGSGRLTVALEGEIRVSDDKVASLTSELKGQSPSPQTTSPQTTPPETTQTTVPR